MAIKNDLIFLFSFSSFSLLCALITQVNEDRSPRWAQQTTYRGGEGKIKKRESPLLFRASIAPHSATIRPTTYAERPSFSRLRGRFGLFPLPPFTHKSSLRFRQGSIDVRQGRFLSTPWEAANSTRAVFKQAIGKDQPAA